MGTPNGTGARRRMRTSGLALLLLAALALLIGLVVAVTRGERSTATERPPILAVPSTSARPSVIPYPPPVSSRPPQAPVVPAPGPPAAAEGAPVGDNGPSEKGPGHSRVRVYNNSTIRGLAARAAHALTAAGWTVVEVGNYARGTIPTTTVYYQDGTDQRADAAALGARFGMRVEPRFAGIDNAGPGLIVIVTNDYTSP
ncbi:MAG: LytR C-terminal domain-containing protein [Pseudonocardiales bacterium]|nr:LytR C-terminal domain-containing protein [Pseudonocardiales bacterium]MBV9032127.1 LytR C-terminal domain-containing protein [Pseudonocardiales bacterium]